VNFGLGFKIWGNCKKAFLLNIKIYNIQLIVRRGLNIVNVLFDLFLGKFDVTYDRTVFLLQEC